MIRGGPFRVVTSTGAAVAAGRFTSSTMPSASFGGLCIFGERSRVRSAPQSSRCTTHVVECRFCNGELTSDWAPSYDPAVARLFVFPKHDHSKVLQRLNHSTEGYRQPWLKRGMSTASAAEAVEASEVLGLQGTEEDVPIKQVTPKYLIGKTQEEMEKIVMSFDEQKYRGKQMHQLIYKNKIKTVKQLAQLPKQLRDAMVEAGWSIGRSPIHHVATSKDGTVKIGRKGGFFI